MDRPRLLRPRERRRSRLTGLSDWCPAPPRPLPLVQVRCLKVLRAIEAGTPAEELVPADFKPSEKALALLSRGPSSAAQHPYVGGVEDTLVIRWARSGSRADTRGVGEAHWGSGVWVAVMPDEDMLAASGCPSMCEVAQVVLSRPAQCQTPAPPCLPVCAASRASALRCRTPVDWNAATLTRLRMKHEGQQGAACCLHSNLPA